MSKSKIAFYKIYKIVIRKVQRVLAVTSLRVSLGAMVTPVGGKLDVAFLSGELGAVVEAELRGHWMPGLTLTGIDEVSIAIAAT